MYIEAFKLLGANPVPMPLAELYTALETRAVDAQEHPIGIFWSSKLYEVQKYLSLTNHGYTPLIVVMNKAKFDALSPELQNAMVEAAKEAGQYQRDLNVKNEKKLLRICKNKVLKSSRKSILNRSKPLLQSKCVKVRRKHGDALLKQVDALAQ